MTNKCTNDCLHCLHCDLAEKVLYCKKGYLFPDFASSKGCEQFHPWQDRPLDLPFISAAESMDQYHKELADTRKAVLAWCNGRLSELDVGIVDVGQNHLSLSFADKDSIYIPLTMLHWFSFGKPVYGENPDIDMYAANENSRIRSAKWLNQTLALSTPAPRKKKGTQHDRKPADTGKVAIHWKDGKDSEFEAGEVRVGNSFLALLAPDKDMIIVPLRGLLWFSSEKPIVNDANPDSRKRFRSIRSHK